MSEALEVTLRLTVAYTAVLLALLGCDGRNKADPTGGEDANPNFPDPGGQPGDNGPSAPDLPIPTPEPTVVPDPQVETPVAVLVGLPVTPSNAKTLSVTVSGAGLVAYKYKLGEEAVTACGDSSSYSAEASADTMITDSLTVYGDGDMRLCVVGRDAAGNWQESASATEAFWVKDTVAPDPGSGILSVDGFSPVGFSLHWQAAVDAGLPGSALLYKVCAALGLDDLSTVDAFDGPKCLLIQDYTANITGSQTGSLASKTQYYVRVAVRDLAGNTGLYPQALTHTPAAVHVVYLDDTNEEVAYATNGTGVFVANSVPGACPVDTTTECGRNATLQLNTANEPRIGYLHDNGSHITLSYIQRDGGVWSVPEDIAPTATVGWNAMALDSQGNPHFSYYERYFGTLSTRDVKYAYRDNTGSWNFEKIHTNDVSGEYTDIALDANDVPYVSFYKNGAIDDLYVANRAGGLNGASEWANVAVVDAVGVTGLYNATTLDGDGRQHVTYFNGTGQDLKYASDATGVWETRLIDSAAAVGQYSKVTVADRGSLRTIQIFYYEATNRDLKAATCSQQTASGPYCTDPGAAWQIQTVYASRSVGSWNSVDRDAAGFVHISTYDASNTRALYILGYYEPSLATWIFQPPVQIDNSAAVGTYTALRAER